MPTESFRTLQAAIEAWNRRDIDAVLERCSEDVVWRLDPPRVYRGRDGVRRFFAEFLEPWEELSIGIEDVIEDREDQIVVQVSLHARGRQGIEVDGRLFHIYRLDEDHLCREFHAFRQGDRVEALREAGLGDG